MGNGASADGNIEIMDVQKRSSSKLEKADSMTSAGRKSQVPSPVHDNKNNNGRKRLEESENDIVVKIGASGFTENEVTVTEGQVVYFIWDEGTSKYGLVQVIHDGEKLRPVIGGYQANCADCDGLYQRQFCLEGEYKFALSGMRCTPVNIIVKKKVDIEAKLTDSGFQPNIIRIDQGHSVKWSWKGCSVPHTIQEVLYLIERGCFKKQSASPSMVATVTGGYRQHFPRAGIFYFLSESGEEVGKTHLCIVHVQDAHREYKLEILDRSFSPMILLIEEGDRVWFQWDKLKCKKSHSVYQIEAPLMGQSDEDPYVPTKDGFRWSTPSKQGLLSHTFLKTGVFYFSDQNFEEAAEYIGTIIVKPKQTEHVIEIDREGFCSDLVFAYTGERIWWKWDGESATDVIQNVLIIEDDKCLNPATKPSSPVFEDLYLLLDKESAALMTKCGMATYHFTTIGVYHFKIAETESSVNTCSVVINPGSKNNTVHLTDDGFEPKVVTIRPNDRVWWVWQSCKKQHNIYQVSHQGIAINDGFQSGQGRDSPSAYVYQFTTPGVYYFISANLPKMFGAVVVSSQPQVHELTVTKNGITPDPVSVQTNDIACWVFDKPEKYPFTSVDSLAHLQKLQLLDISITPRRCFGLAIDKTGISHYTSKMFHDKTNNKKEAILSSIICDERCDNTTIHINKNGFHPNKVYLKTGHSVLWNWKGTNEEHNIIHVNSPNSEQPLNIIEGVKSFNSGKLLRNNSFLYTFDEVGMFTVASQGAPGYSCDIHIQENAKRSEMPFIQDGNGGTVDRYHVVHLLCNSLRTDIYYTTDGSPPALYSNKTKKYEAEKGVVLNHLGFTFIRAISVEDGFVVSHIFTSKRFTVMSPDSDVEDEASEESVEVRKENPKPTDKKDWDWMNSVPVLKGCFTGPGEMELFWEQPSENSRQIIRGYNVLLNGVGYCPIFPVYNNSLNITGLAGNRFYQVVVEVYAKDSRRQLKSNTLNLRCPIRTQKGGPVISLEIPEKNDSISIVWMAIDSDESRIDGYVVFINDQQCGPKLVPDPNSNRCKVIIGSCMLNTPYKIYVDAHLTDLGETRMSNVIEMQLPLETDGINLPPIEERDNDEEIYCEYIEVHEGSGYLPQMDETKNRNRENVIEVETKGCEPLSERKKALKTWASADSYTKDSVEKKANTIEQSRQEFYIKDGINRTTDALGVYPEKSNRSFYSVAKFVANFIGAQRRLSRLHFTPGKPKSIPLNWGMLKNVFDKTRIFEGHTKKAKQTPGPSNSRDAADNEESTQDHSRNIPQIKQPVAKPLFKKTKAPLASPRLHTDTSQDLSETSEIRLLVPQQTSYSRYGDKRLALPRQNSNPLSESSDTRRTVPRQNSQPQSDYSETRLTVPRQNSHPHSDYARRSREGFMRTRQVRSSEDDKQLQIPSMRTANSLRQLTSSSIFEYAHGRPPLAYADQAKLTSRSTLDFEQDVDEVSFDSEFDDMSDRSYRRDPYTMESNSYTSHGRTGNYFHDLYERQIRDEYRISKRHQMEEEEFREPDPYHHAKSVIKEHFPYKDEVGNYPPQIDYYEKRVMPPREYGGMLDRYLESFQKHHSNVDFTEDPSVTTEDHYKYLVGKEEGKKVHLPNTAPPVPVESETESETDSSEWASQEEDDVFREKNVIILDASNNKTTDTLSKRKGAKDRRHHGKGKSPRRKHFSPRKGQYVDVEGDGIYQDELPSPKGKGKRRNRTTAIVEVQQMVELDVQDSGVVEDGPLMREQKRLAVPVSANSNMFPVGEGEFILGDGDGILPAPSIMVESKGKKGVSVVWELPESPDANYKLLLYVVNVVGLKFTKEINSDISFECNLVEKEEPVRGVQHCWNVQGEEKCNVKGLLPGLTYRIYVIANYTHLHGDQSCEIQTTSSVLYYTTMGPPKPPVTSVIGVEFYQATIEWLAPSIHPDVKLRGYQIYVDNKKLGGVRSYDVQQMVINNMIPGKTVCVNVVAITSKASQESDPSKSLYLTCPKRPPSPVITQQPSFKQGCVLIAWEKPKGFNPSSNAEELTSYCVYIDGMHHGEVKANKLCDRQGYQFFLTDLSPEQCYDVTVKAVSGHRDFDSEGQHFYCLSDSPMSNIISVRAPAAPKSPTLRLEGLHPNGIDVTWQVPQQFGDASISGYQMLKNGTLYGAVIPPDVNSLKIRDVSLGEKLDLQLIALTEHPVGKSDKSSVSGSSFQGDKDSGLGGSTKPDDKKDNVFLGERYSGCKPGPKLQIHFTGLVQPPTDVRCEKVTGHSALIVWNRDRGTKPHYVTPDSYQVTWWPGNKAQDDINSDSTTDDHLLITNLKPSTTYTIIIEARKMETYSDINEIPYDNETTEGLNAFILTAKSNQISLTTASPPNPARNLGIKATTCNSITVVWDAPEEHGAEVIGIRIECVTADDHESHFVICDALPDANSADITNLHERKDYNVRVIAITDEYFDRLPDKHQLKKSRTLPRDILMSTEDSVWLPSSSILAKTAGTDQPSNLKIVQSSMTVLILTWTPPLVYGSNKLQGQIIRWSDVKRSQKEDGDLVVANHVRVLPTDDTIKIEDLYPGAQYKIVVEAVVSIKTSLEAENKVSGIEKYRRTAHVMSKPLLARTRAPIEAPKLLVNSYNKATANLYWEKPPLLTVIGKDDEGKPKYLRRYLEGYKLEINGKLQCYLGPNAQNCTLTKCRAGKAYSVVLVAVTCTEEGKKARKQKFKGFFKNINPQNIDYAAILNDDENLDESPSEALEVALPKDQEGFLSTLQVVYRRREDKQSGTVGVAEVTWKVQGNTSLIKQFRVVWYCMEDRIIQTKHISPELRECTIPIIRIKTLYNISVEPVYYTDVVSQSLQDVQVMIPGPPDAPEIFLRCVDPEEFIIEWGEPRVFGGVKIKGYQVYLNDKKVGLELSNSHRKAVIPCRQNRTYKINLVAMSENTDYNDSPKSNTLMISTSNTLLNKGEPVTIDDWASTDDSDIPLKVIKILESAIHLDWSVYFPPEEIAFYKVQWSSVAQPTQREVKLSAKDSNCVINKCLPGTNHFVRLVAYDKDGNICEKSKQLTVQTSAPPDSPLLSIRACNFRYLAIQWEKPTEYGDAMISGYKVFVNGIVEASLSADTLSYTFTHGQWCNEYAFQVQALTAEEKMNSRVSDQLIVTWPGAKSPPIHRIPSVSSSTLRVGWGEPHLTDGIKVKHFKLCCVEEDTEKLVQSVGPIHPDTRAAEFDRLKKGNYSVYLETHLYGTGDLVRSDIIRMQPSLSPDAPHIAATMVGLEERRQLEKLTCDLVNKRDRLIRAVGHKLKRIGALSHPVKAEKDEDIVIGAHTLTRVEELLEECFSALEQYTGQLIAYVSWQCPQSNPDMCVSGYKVLIDGKQYGNALHAAVKTVKVKLDLSEPSYKLSLIALTDKPQGTSDDSNTVELLTSPFQPFSFYCYHEIHNRDARWPNPGCCKFDDSTSYERQVAKKLANQGLLLKRVPPPACNVLDIFDGEYKPFMSTHKPQYPSAILFWTPWCKASLQTCRYFMRFARENNEINCVAVACGVSGVTAVGRKTIADYLTSMGLRDDKCVWHCTSECSSTLMSAKHEFIHTSAGIEQSEVEKEKQMDLTELLGVVGVPTLFIVNPEGYLAWHGRYSSFDYTAYTGFMHHTVSEVLHQPCPVYNCDCCHNNMSIDEEALGFLAQEPKNSTAKNVRIAFDEGSIMNGRTHSHDDISGERIFYKQKGSHLKKVNSRISVDQRPISASSLPVQYHRSPYLAQVTPPSPRFSRFRPSSARKSNN